MKPFLRFLTCLLLLTAATCVLLVVRFHTPFPYPLGPELDEKLRDAYTQQLETTQASVVLMGDSALLDSVDPDRFEQLTGRKTLYLAIPGSSSAQWYLILKNNLLHAAHKPDAVVIFFRDTMLTTPDFRVSGKYLLQIDELATAKDTDLLDRAYLWPMSPLERLIGAYFPPYSGRQDMREKLDARLKYTLPARLFGCQAQCVEDALYETFSTGRMDHAVMGAAVEEGDSYLYTLPNMVFNARVERSFLPLMVQLARESGVRLIFVQARTRDGLDATRQPLLLGAYQSALESYLAKQGVTYFSFAKDTRITTAFFKDTIHMNSAGKVAFTPLFAQALQPLLSTGK